MAKKVNHYNESSHNFYSPDSEIEIINNWNNTYN